MKPAAEIASEYLKSFDRYYLPEQEKELTEAIEQYAKQKAVKFAKHSINESYISEQREREWQEWYDEFINQK